MKQRRKWRGRTSSSWGLIAIASVLCLLLVLTQACNSQIPATQNASPKNPPIAQSSDPLPPPSTVPNITNSPATHSPPPLPLNPQPERLITDLKALQGERYSDRDRLKTRTYLTQTLQSEGWQVEEQPFATGTNLIATWPEPTRASARSSASPKLLIGAHYDTVAGSPGADDNGTGVVAILEIARLYAQQAAEAPELAADLILVLFDREEAGLEGSLAFATPERVAGLRGAIILEMLGFTCHEPGCQTYPEFLEQRPESEVGDFIAVVGDVEHPELLKAFQQSASEQFALGQSNPQQSNPQQSEPQQAPPDLAPVFPLSVPFKGLLTPDVLRSDHSPFWLRGLGAVMVTDTANLRNPHYHQASDRLDTLDLEFFEQGVRRVLSAIAQLQSS